MNPRGKAAAAEALKGLALWGLILLEVPLILATMAQLQSMWKLGPIFNFLLALVASFIPILGGVLAFFGAANVWNWPIAGGIIFLVPVALYGLALTFGAKPIEE